MPAVKVLIAEDEAVSAVFLEHILQEKGYQIAAVVSTAEEAVQKAEETRPDVVLMDIILEGELDGLAAAAKIVEHHKIPVIYITALSDLETIEKVKTTDPYGFVTKPFERNYLYIVLELALHKHRLEEERRKTQEAIRLERDLWKYTFDAVPDLITILDRDRRIVKLNTALAEKLRCRPEDCVGTLCYESLHKDGVPPVLCPHQMLLEDGLPHSLELTEERLGGDFLVTASPLLDEKGHLTGSIHVARDISDLKKAERKLRKAHDELELRVKERTMELVKVNKALTAREVELSAGRETLRKLAGSLLTAQENERRRLARELHDDLSQRLAVLAIEARTMEHYQASHPERIQERLAHFRDELIKISEDVHDLSRQLHPSILEDLGLFQALNWECLIFEKREKIKVTLKVDHVPPALPKDIAICIYRIIQESLKNVAKHAHAKRVTVNLTFSPGEIILTITDKGVGFDRATNQGKPGIGLTSMEERALLINGRLTIESSVKKGTTVKLTVPYGDTAH